MITEWRAPEYGQRQPILLHVDSEQVMGSGAGIAPALIIPIRAELNSSGSQSMLTDIVEAAGVELYATGQTNYPTFTSGLQPITSNRSYVHVAVNSAYIDSLQGAPASQNGLVSLTLRLGVLLKSPAADALPDHTGTVVSTGTAQVQVPIARWYETILPALGYPRHRMVPLPLDLPESLKNSRPDAQKCWGTAVERLQNAERTLFTSIRTSATVTEAVNALRDAVDGSLRTWLCLWENAPAEKANVGVLLQALDSLIPECQSSQGRSGQKITNDAMRVCSHAISLHNLAVLTNPTHHIGTQTIYSPIDAESWFLMTLGAMRSLPGLWAQFPSPRAISASNGHGSG